MLKEGNKRKVQGRLIPTPDEECPSRFAERLGRFYSESTSCDHKKALGQYLTPLEVAQFMARLSEISRVDSVRILDPGAGAGILSSSILEELSHHKKTKKIFLDAYELDGTLADYLERVLTYASSWLRGKNIHFEYRIKRADFILENAALLDRSPQLFEAQHAIKPEFDIVISNPPYFKIPITDPRAKAASTVVYGQPNIYAIFMAVSSALLRENGELIIITPRSYAAGPYFQRFREYFFETMQPNKIHLFASRKDAFNRDEVLQEHVILHAKRMVNWAKKNVNFVVQLTTSSGLGDLDFPARRRVPITDVLDSRLKGKILRIPTSAMHDEASKIVHSWSGSLNKFGLQISTGPIVPFRAANLLSRNGRVSETHAPLLWMQNVTAMNIEWPKQNATKQQYVTINEAARPILVLNKNYILLRRFSAKEQEKRLTAAPYLSETLESPFLGLENHLNYIHRPNGKLHREEVYGLAGLLNSSLLDEYFRTSNGNTQVSATELRAMPLPSIDIITYLGKRILSEKIPLMGLDDLMSEVLNYDADFNMRVNGAANA